MTTAPSPRLPEIHRFRLDNGLRVNLQADPALPLVAINLWYHVGSKDERPGRTGFAHLFEHMLFQGSENVGVNDHFRLIQQIGGVANGSTWFDRTNYFETVPAHYLERGLWLEADRMGRLLPAMTEEKLATQREVVMNERRQTVDNQPYGRAMERLHELLYPQGHPYSWPVIGYMEDIAAASLEEVRAFFRTYYAPNNAVLTLAGDLSLEESRELVERHFGGIPSGPPPPPVEVPENGHPPREARREVLRDTVQLPRLYLAFEVPRYGEPGWYAAELLSTALTGGKASLLYRDLVYHRELAQDVSCYAFPTELTATFLLVATARPQVAPETLEGRIREHLEALASRPLEDPAVEQARRKTLTGYFEDLQLLDERADLISQFTTLLGDPGHLDDEVALYAGLEAGDLHRLAAARLTPERGVWLWVLPGAKEEGSE